MSVRCLVALMVKVQDCKLLAWLVAWLVASASLNSDPNVPVFKVDFHQLSISAEKPLNVFFADMIAQSSDIYPRHAVVVVPGAGTSLYSVGISLWPAAAASNVRQCCRPRNKERRYWLFSRQRAVGKWRHYHVCPNGERWETKSAQK